MSTEREQGVAALQRGDMTNAIALLEAACQQDANDYQAHLYLGVAYGQAGRDNDAISPLTRAVHIEPANAQARYNLGIALERAGWPTEAQTALQQALTLQPDYPKAQEALRRLQEAATPTAPAPTQAYATAPEPTMQTPPETGLAGYNTTPSEPVQPAYNAPSTEAVPSPAPYGAPIRPVIAAATTPYFEDRFDLKQAFKDWGKVITAPQAFFQDQVGREGKKAPMAMLLAYSLVGGLAYLIGGLIGGGGGLAVGMALGTVMLGFPFFILGMLIAAALYHWIGGWFGNRASYDGSFRAATYASAPAQLLSAIGTIIALASMVGMTSGFQTGRQTPSPDQPRIVLAQYGNDTPATRPENLTGQPGRGDASDVFGQRPGGAAQNPFEGMTFFKMMAGNLFSGILNLIGLIWTLVLLVIGLSTIQRISQGAALGVVALTILISCIVGVALFLLIMLFVVGAVVGVTGAGGLK